MYFSSWLPPCCIYAPHAPLSKAEWKEEIIPGIPKRHRKHTPAFPIHPLVSQHQQNPSQTTYHQKQDPAVGIHAVCLISSRSLFFPCWHPCFSSEENNAPKVPAESLARQGEQPRAQFDTWRRTTHRHEQVAIGQLTSRSRKKIKRLLKKLERRINGQQTWLMICVTKRRAQCEGRSSEMDTRLYNCV